MMTRSKRVTHENLRIRDEGYIAAFDRWFADNHGAAELEPAPPPMFTPLKLRGLELHNRVVVSPMCQYSATDGFANNWHLVHLGGFANGGFGAVMMVTATFGMVAAARAVERLAEGRALRPSRRTPGNA